MASQAKTTKGKRARRDNKLKRVRARKVKRRLARMKREGTIYTDSK